MNQLCIFLGMFLFRPLEEKDKASVFKLASLSEAGLTTLTPDPKVLEKLLDEALRSFNSPVQKPGGETYLFVLENLESHKILGTAGMVSKVGGFQPFWSYQIKKKRLYSKSLQLGNEIKYLQLKTEHNGPSEIGTLFLHPDWRKNNLGRFLSLSRFMFMASFPHLFEKKVLAELRGVVDKKGNAPFWNAVGSHFIHLDYSKADYMTMLDKSFIQDLFPKHPIYIDLLPEDARDVIGKVHPDTQPALNLLLSEGFQLINEVDIFEGGPSLMAPLKRIRCIRERKAFNYEGISKDDTKTVPGLLSPAEDIARFKCYLVDVNIRGNNIFLDSNTASRLDLKTGQEIHFSPLKGNKNGS